MKPYCPSNTEEKETYDQYKERKEMEWTARARELFIEINDSSLKFPDKEKFVRGLLRKMNNNNLKYENWL